MKYRKRLVVGDVHGAFTALTQALDRAGFKPEVDLLISLGDLCDGWPWVKEVLQYVRDLPNFRWVLGNHDEWAYDWLRGAAPDPIWYWQGGKNTIRSFVEDDEVSLHRWVPEKVQEEWRPYFRDKVEPYIILDNMGFFHAGFNPKRSLVEQSDEDLMWSRDFFWMARYNNSREPLTTYDRVFIGHTTTETLQSKEGRLEGIPFDLRPRKFEDVWMLDTGAGWSGKLTVMDIDTEEYWQSDNVLDLYPNVRGR